MGIFSNDAFQVEIEYLYIKTDMMNAAVYYVPGVTCKGIYREQRWDLEPEL